MDGQCIAQFPLSVTAPPLSPAQLRAVQHRGSDLQLIACAGSGKTETVAQRVSALIEEGAAPESIVAFTFTERAALELKDRILKRVKEKKGAAFLDRLGPMYVGTIHGYCFRLLQDHVPKYGSYDMLDENRHPRWTPKSGHQWTPENRPPRLAR